MADTDRVVELKHMEHLHQNQTSDQVLNEHNNMFLVLMACIMIMQFVIIWWKRSRPLSFKLFEVACLWLIPFLVALSSTVSSNSTELSKSKQQPPYRFEFVWLLFTVGNAYIVWMAYQRPLKPTTFRLIYRWFQRCYQVCYSLGVVGYVLFMADFFGVSQLAVFQSAQVSNSDASQLLNADNQEDAPIRGNPWFFQTAILLLFYALYFGMLARDLIDLLSQSMAISVGYFVPEGLPNKHLRGGVCALCGDLVSQPGHINSAARHQADEMSMLIPSVKLPCRHLFHEPCIRGWILIGKKDMCPYCKEKCSYKQLNMDRGQNVWDTQQIGYLWVLDTMRFFIVYVPLLGIVVRGANYVFGLK